MKKASDQSWILGRSGQLKLATISQSYFLNCVRRLNLSPETSYLPWMSSDDICLAYLGKDEKPSLLNPATQFDFRSAYLRMFLNLFSLSPGTEVFTKGLKIDIFHEILDAMPHSLETYDQAVRLIKHWSDWQQELFQGIVKSVLPLCAADTRQECDNSFGTRHCVGAIFTGITLSSPYPDISLNISFAHELGHQALMHYQFASEILPDAEEWIYSGVRKTLRPPISALHAAVALSYMIECCRGLIYNENDIARRAFLNALLSEYHDALSKGLKALQPVPKSKLAELIIGDLNHTLNVYL